MLALKYLVELLKLYEHTVARRPPRDRKLLAKTLKVCVSVCRCGCVYVCV